MALRTIETDGLTCLGPAGYGPWRLGDDRLLRTSADLAPLRTEADAQALYDTYHAARLAGAPTPDALEIVRVADGYGVVVEYVVGLPLGTHLLFGTYSIEDAGRIMGALARKLHAVHMEAGRDWNAVFSQRTHRIVTLLSPWAGNRLASLVEKIPPSDTLIHGDLHAVNMVVMDDACYPIDLESAGFGHPAFDLAIARSRLTGAVNSLAANMRVQRELGERASHRIWRALLRSYFEGTCEPTLDDLDRRIEVLAHIETCRQICSNHPGDVNRLNKNLRRQLTASVQRMEELLPCVARLDF